MTAAKRRERTDDAVTVAEFCRNHRIGRNTYYEMRKRGLTPDVMKLGTKTLITKEAAARWREQRTAETKKNS
jgi:phage terminase small subunit